MKAKQTYLKGKSVFKVSLIVIVVTILTVYFTGENYNRSITLNFYISLSIIGFALFLFMTYGLYKGIDIKDNYPDFKGFNAGDFIPGSGTVPDFDLPTIDTDDGISGLIISVLLWIAMTILFFALLLFLEAFIWFSIFIILAMLYWLFFRALRLVFSKSDKTRGDLGASLMYSISYTLLYLGWIFGIVYLSQLLR